VTLRVPATQARALSAYVDSANNTLLLGPKGWKCVGGYGADGSGGLALYAPGEAIGTASPSKSQQAITTFETGGSSTQGAAAACPLFATAQAQFQSAFGHGCSQPPKSVTIAHPSADVATFDDPPGVAFGDPSGGPYRAQGVVSFSTTASPTTWQATCTVSTQYQSFCPTVLDYFSALYSGARAGTPLAAMDGGKYVVWPQGGVDGLRFGTATEADIVGVFGNPAKRFEGSFSAPGRPDYIALSYDCPGPLGSGEFCTTTFFINKTTSTFEAFLTSSTQYETGEGATVGMSAQQASTLEDVSIQDGCRSDVGPIEYLARMYLDLSAPGAGQVSDIAMESLKNDVGLLFC
jgi:hypothetical protein